MSTWIFRLPSFCAKRFHVAESTLTGWTISSYEAGLGLLVCHPALCRVHSRTPATPADLRSRREWVDQGTAGHSSTQLLLLIWAAPRECAPAGPGLYLTMSPKCHPMSDTNICHHNTPSLEWLAGQLHSHLGPGLWLLHSDRPPPPIRGSGRDQALWDTDTPWLSYQASGCHFQPQTPHCFLFMLEKPLVLGGWRGWGGGMGAG